MELGGDSDVIMAMPRGCPAALSKAWWSLTVRPVRTKVGTRRLRAQQHWDEIGSVDGLRNGGGHGCAAGAVAEAVASVRAHVA